MDGRWVCKITDYGLRNIKQYAAISSDNKKLSDDSLLWTAPELLRNNITTAANMQKGDVFSFGIICQEIVLQNLPYGSNEPELPPSDIISMLKKGVQPFIRPQISNGKEVSSLEYIF